jgi:hypothetical protein
MGDNDPFELDAPEAAIRAWYHFKKHPRQDLSTLAMQDVGSDIFFLRRKPGSKSIGEQSEYYYIPTPHLRGIFEQHRPSIANEDFLQLYFNLSSHALTRTPAGWMHEQLMHRSLCTSEETFSIFQGPTKRGMQASLNLLTGTVNTLKMAGANDSFYWVPAIVSLPGIDSVLGDTSGNLYTMQATIAGNHSDPIKGIQQVWDSFKPEVRAKRTWHCVVFAEDKQAADRLAEVFSQYLDGFRLGGAPVRVWGWFPSH